MLIRLIGFLCLLAGAASAQAYVTARTLELDAGDARRLVIHAGQGGMIVRGGPAGQVEAELVIEFDSDWSEEDAEALLSEALVFELVEAGSGLRLDVRLEHENRSSWLVGGFLRSLLYQDGRNTPSLYLEVTLPSTLDLEVHDGSGDMDISALNGALVVHDGSGLIEVSGIGGGAVIHDGSGDIRAEDIEGFLEVHDGSGAISLSRIRAGAEIHDGSGDIRVTDAGGHVRIMDGSGDVDVRDITGDLTIRDGSGDIDVDGVTGDAFITEGSGHVSIRGVEGRVLRR